MGSVPSSNKESKSKDSTMNRGSGGIDDGGGAKVGGGDGARGGGSNRRVARKNSLADASLPLPRPTPFSAFTMETAAAIVDGIPEDRRVVLLGESTHGTEEFYRTRAEITKRLIDERVGQGEGGGGGEAKRKGCFGVSSRRRRRACTIDNGGDRRKLIAISSRASPPSALRATGLSSRRLTRTSTASARRPSPSTGRADGFQSGCGRTK